MANIKSATIKDLIPDDKNANRGTKAGSQLLEKSLSELGAGRSILLDKNNNIIAGNKTAETAAAIGLDRVKIVEVTGDELVAVKRIDIDINSAKGRELALADNKVGQINLEWDPEVLQDLALDFDIDLPSWGFPDIAAEEAEEEEASEGGGSGSGSDEEPEAMTIFLPPHVMDAWEKWKKDNRKRSDTDAFIHIFNHVKSCL